MRIPSRLVLFPPPQTLENRFPPNATSCRCPPAWIGVWWVCMFSVKWLPESSLIKGLSRVDSTLKRSRVYTTYKRREQLRKQRRNEGDSNMAFMTSSLLPLLLVLILGVSVSADVVTLTDNTFADKVKEKDTVWFIKFFAPWCGHCKKLAPTWEELGKSLDGENGVEIGLVDCTTQKKTCTDADIRSYPQLRIFYDGKDIKKYSGPRDLESLKTYALNAAAELSKVDDGEAAAE